MYIVHKYIPTVLEILQHSLETCQLQISVEFLAVKKMCVYVTDCDHFEKMLRKTSEIDCHCGKRLLLTERHLFPVDLLVELKI